MAVPTIPTATSIVIEAFKNAGVASPTSTQINRGKDEFLERVKNQIWTKVIDGGDTRMKTLQHSAVLIGSVGQRTFATPSDFSEEFSVTILDGTHRDILTAGASGQYTLAADEDATEAEMVGAYFLGLTGTCLGEYRQTLTYSTTTKVGTITPDWDTGTTPVSGDTYVIVDEMYKLKEVHHLDIDEITRPTTVGRPEEFAKFADEIYFNKPLDIVYGIRLRYYAALNKVNLTEGSSTLISKIYSQWQTILEQGVLVRVLKWLDDDNAKHEEKVFYVMLDDLIYKELPYGGEFEGFTI